MKNIFIITFMVMERQYIITWVTSSSPGTGIIYTVFSLLNSCWSLNFVKCWTEWSQLGLNPKSWFKDCGKRRRVFLMDSLRSLSLARASVHLMTLYTWKQTEIIPFPFLTIGPAMHIEIQYTQSRKNALNKKKSRKCLGHAIYHTSFYL